MVLSFWYLVIYHDFCVLKSHPFYSRVCLDFYPWKTEWNDWDNYSLPLYVELFLHKSYYSKLLFGHWVDLTVYFCCSVSFFKNINEVVASITSIKIANCVSSTIATTRIAAAHMIELEINIFLLIFWRHLYLFHRDWLIQTVIYSSL